MLLVELGHIRISLTASVKTVTPAGALTRVERLVSRFSDQRHTKGATGSYAFVAQLKFGGICRQARLKLVKEGYVVWPD